MNIKKLPIGDFFITFIWFVANLFITFATSNNKRQHNNGRCCPGSRLHLNKSRPSRT